MAESKSEVRNKKLVLKICFHTGVILHHSVVFIIGLYIIFTYLTEELLKEPLISMAYTYFPAYLTIWNFSFQTIFLGLALLHDVLRWLDKHDSKLGKRIKYLRDVIFNGLVFPFTCFVTGMFWGVYLIDRELVFPQVYDQIVPWWLNHCVHTNIFIVIAIETLLTRRRQPTDVKVERFLWVFVSVFYAVVYYSVYFFGGCWLYGVFGVMTWWQVCIYQACIWCSTWIFYNLNFFVNRMIHREGEVTPKSSINGDLESRETSEVARKIDGARDTGLGSSKLRRETDGGKDNNGFNEDSVNGKVNVHINDNNDVENEKQWKSIGVNRNDEDSVKFKRNQFEKSSL